MISVLQFTIGLYFWKPKKVFVKYESDFRTIDVHIKRIREKLEDVDEFEIVTVRGIGYKSIIKGEN